MIRAKRVGSATSATRIHLLNVAERLMLDEGYSAVTTRGVAAKAGLKSPLVHYYFPTTDDLLLALYRLASERTHKRTMEAVTSGEPLEALWNLSKEPEHTALAIELAALANHHLLVRRKTAEDSVRYRVLQTQALSEALKGKLDSSAFAPIVAIMLIQGIARILVAEEALDVTLGHSEARSFVDWLLRRVRLDQRTQSGGASAVRGRRRTVKVTPPSNGNSIY